MNCPCDERIKCQFGKYQFNDYQSVTICLECGRYKEEEK